MESDKTGSQFARPSEKLILIVDDDETVRSLLELRISIEGFRVLLAVNGRDAVAKLTREKPDLIITDLMMPDQGGYELLRALAEAGIRRVPVFVITAAALDPSTITMIKQEANVVEFVAKPITMPLFLAALHRHLRTTPASRSSSRGLNDRG